MREKALRCLSGLPPFSPILTRLMASLAHEDVSFSKLADLIEKDTVVAGRTLQMVNSAMYARRGTISSVRHAVSLLGFTKLRNAILSMSITKMWDRVRPPTSWSMARFNMHSAATAILCDLLAQKLPVEYPEGAFISGLLHDVGRLLIAVGLPDEHERILRLYKAGRPLPECEFEILGFAHPELSAQALEFWNLPAPIQTAVREHHAPSEPTNPKSISLARLVHAADQYIHCSGVSIVMPEKLEVKGPLRIQMLGLDVPRLETVLGEFKAEYAVMSEFFR